MFRLWQIVLLYPAIITIGCEDYNNYDDLLKIFTKLFKTMNIHTVQSFTCWDTRINRGLLTKLSNEDISITFDIHKAMLQDLVQRPSYRSGMLVDLACDQASNLLHQASSERQFNLRNHWILFDGRGRPANDSDSSNLVQRMLQMHLGRAYVLPDSRVYLLIRSGGNTWEVWDGFRLSVRHDIQVSRVGVVTNPELVDIENPVRTNFQRAMIRASTVILEPDSFPGWNTIHIPHNLDKFAHMHHTLSILLSEQLNFTLNLTFSPDYGWNYGNGTYSGLVGELQREEIDFTAAGGLMRTDRMDVCELTVGTFRARTQAIFRKPPLSSVNNIFTLPFTLGVWIVLFVIIFVFTLALIMLSWASSRLKGGRLELSTVLDTVTMVLGSICQQGLSITTHTTPARMATFILFLSAVFLFTSYAASIVVLLQSTSQAIKNRKDLADTAITFSVQDTRHNYIYFNESENESIRSIWNQKVKPQGKDAFTNPDVGMERVRNEFHAFLVEITLAYHIIAKTWQEHEKCSLSETELYKIPLLTLYVVKKSGYKDAFKQKIIQQNEVGIKYRTYRNIMPQKQKCDSTNSAVINFDSVSLKEIRPALLLLLYGICISLLIFLFEHLYEIRMTNRKNIRK